MKKKLTYYLKFLLNNFILSLIPICSYASLLDNQEIILAPKCFVENNGFEYNELAFNKNSNMVLFSVNKETWWQNLNDINHKADCGKFINVYNDWNDYSETKALSNTRVSSADFDFFLAQMLSEINNNSLTSNKYHKQTSFTETKQAKLDDLYTQVDADRISKSLDELTDHYNRAAYNDNGYKAAKYINDWMEALAKQANKSEEEFSVEYIATGGYYKQPSVVAVLGKDKPGEALVISAHMDTNGGGRRPGADDDGSGSMVVLEAARLIVNSGYEFNRPIYFMWYAAEEMGLVGSRVVAKEVKSRELNIDSVLHFDTVGRRANANDSTLFLLRDNVDQSFTDYIANLLTEQVKVPVDYTRCGYACSDHASWFQSGVSSAAGFESTFDDINPYIHTSNDTKEHVTIENLVNFTKLALAYAIDKAVE